MFSVVSVCESECFLCFNLSFVITAHKGSLRRLCFYTCLLVILFTGVYLGRYIPLAGTHPPGRYTPLGRYTRQVHPQPSWAGTPPGQVPTLPKAGTPPPDQCMLGDMGNKRVEWNAFLLNTGFQKKNQSRKVLSPNHYRMAFFV